MRAILIGPQDELREEFIAAQMEHKGLTLSKVFTEYPAAEVLRRAVRAWAPEVVFISLLEPGAAEVVSRQLEMEFPGVQRLGLHTDDHAATFRLGLRLRLREVLVAPFERAEIGDILAQTREHLEQNPNSVPVSNQFLSFVPAKPGSGASTVAANTTWALSRMQKSDVLLADFDLASGIIGFLFNTAHEHGVADALARAHEMDDEAWQRLLKKIGNIDLLLSDAPHIPEGTSGTKIQDLIDYVRRLYDVVCVDLPDALDETSLAVLRESDRIFLVTTPELPAVRMARLKVAMFRKLDLEDKVHLVVNRVKKSSALQSAEIESTVGMPVYASFPCAYDNVTRSIQRGESASALAATAESLAAKILNRKLDPEKQARFVERFAILPMRYSFR